MEGKIFCIGLNKTGTSSLHAAFKILNIKSVHWKDEKGNNIKHIINNNYLNKENILKGIDNFEAYSDWDFGKNTHQIFKEFDIQYPNSKFILNTRDLEGWLNSREKHVLRNQKRNKENPASNFTWLKVDRPAWELQYKKHHEEIYAYFKDRRDELLIFDVTKGDGWEKLCPFLELPIPQAPFPKTNVAPKPKTFVQKIKKRMLHLLKKHKII